MPLLKIYGNKPSTEYKNIIAKKMWEEFQKVIQIPQFEIYFIDIDGCYENGEEIRTPRAVLEMEGPQVPIEKIEKLCIMLCTIYQESVEGSKVSFTYHENLLNHLGNVHGLLESHN